MANYDHPSYITRQQEYVGQTTAGAGTVAYRQGFATGMRLRRLTATVVTAGTSTAAGYNVLLLTGTATATIGSVVVSTNTANTVVTSADFNAIIPVGSAMAIQNSTDATCVLGVSFETHLDPVLGVFANP